MKRLAVVLAAGMFAALVAIPNSSAGLRSEDFSCRAAPLRAQGGLLNVDPPGPPGPIGPIEPFVANGPRGTDLTDDGVPCYDDPGNTPPAPPDAKTNGGPSIAVDLNGNGTTDLMSSTLSSLTVFDINGSPAKAEASVEDLATADALAGLGLKAIALKATAQVNASGGECSLETSGSVTGATLLSQAITVDGAHVHDGETIMVNNQPVMIPDIPGVVIHFNHTETTLNSVTRRALWIEWDKSGAGQVLPDVIVSEAHADFTSSISCVSPVLTLSPNSATNQVGQSHTVTAKVTEAGQLEEGVLVRFTVTNPQGGDATPSSGTCRTDSNGQCTFTFTATQPGTYTISAYTDLDEDNKQDSQEASDTATKTYVQPPPPGARFMTGGGQFARDPAAAGKMSHGFHLLCGPSSSALNSTSNNLEVNWAGNNWHLVTLTKGQCDNGADGINKSGNPAAGFDTYTGEGTGRCGSGGTATAKWTFVDNGEPGKNDTAKIEISGGCSVKGDGKLEPGGNHQAH